MTALPPRAPGLGTGDGALAELLADGTYPLSVTSGWAANREPFGEEKWDGRADAALVCGTSDC